MNTVVAKKLCAMNTAFYANNAKSFSDTRKVPWPGWQRCMDVMGYGSEAARPGAARSGAARASVTRTDDVLSVLDMACGNMRFKSFLENYYNHTIASYYAIDNCDALAMNTASDVAYQDLDILDVLASGGSLAKAIHTPPCDLSVAFGFMHHVPLQEWRASILKALIAHTAVGGFIAVSFWMFASDEGMAAKAKETTAQTVASEPWLASALGANDYILGWGGVLGVRRYCHSFTDEEVDELAASVISAAEPVASFKSDGRTGELNAYLVLRRC
jgi:hypothetical protein